MRFLVIGGSGFVGSNVLAHLKACGFQVAGTQSSARNEGLITFNLLQHRIADRLPPGFLKAEGQLFVIISAVISNMDLCLQDRPMSHRVNVEQTIQLIEDCTRLGAKIVFLSSCFVFDGKLGYYNEDHALSPANEYGRHKVEVEEHLGKSVPGAFVARLDKVVGDDPLQSHLLAHWHTRLTQGQPIVCLEGSLLSPTYVMDVARAIEIACRVNLRGVHHVSNSEFFYRDELARQFCYALGMDPRVESKKLEDFHFADNRALKSYLDGSRFAKIASLRFTPMREVFGKFRQKLGR